MRKTMVAIGILFVCTVVSSASFRVQKDERLFREARILIFDENWDEALQKLEDLLDNYPDSPLFAKATFNKGICLKEMEGNEVEALQTFKEYLRINGSDRSLTEEAETSIIDLALQLYSNGRTPYLREVEDRLLSENSVIRYYAAFEMSYIEDKSIAVRAVPALRRILREEADERLRYRAEIALLRIDPDIFKEIDREDEPREFKRRVLNFGVYNIEDGERIFYISIPWSLADLIFSIIPEQSRSSMKKQGVDVNQIVSDLTHLQGKVFEVRDDEEGILIKIWLE